MNFDNYYPFSAAALPYDFAALRPYISEYTMYFHHDKHYKNYLGKLNAILEGRPLMQNVPLEALTAMADEDIRNAAGGVYNHELYFSSLTPDYAPPSENMRSMISSSFGSEKEMRDEAVSMGMDVNGSGWIWLVYVPAEKRLEWLSSPNQEAPDFDRNVPLLNIDLWEHAYYLDRQNLRRDYLNAVMDILDWSAAEKRLIGELADK